MTNVSVIVPVYNDQAGIERCLVALACQNYPQTDYEIIIVDNGSAPPIRIKHAVNCAVRIIQCDNPGAYSARNAGMAVAAGDIFAFTDADCIPHKDWISSGVAALRQQNFQALIGGEIRLALSENPTAIEKYQYLIGFMQRENIETKGFTATANLFVARHHAMQIGPFRDSLLSGGDREWSWRAQYAGLPVKYSSSTVVVTSPRSTLHGAIRQARRVAGGRRSLSEMKDKHVEQANIRSHRSVYSSAMWILKHPDLSAVERIKVLSIAAILKIATVLELFRLRFGARAERR